MQIMVEKFDETIFEGDADDFLFAKVKYLI